MKKRITIVVEAEYYEDVDTAVDAAASAYAAGTTRDVARTADGLAVYRLAVEDTDLEDFDADESFRRLKEEANG